MCYSWIFHKIRSNHHDARASGDILCKISPQIETALLFIFKEAKDQNADQWVAQIYDYWEYCAFFNGIKVEKNDEFSTISKKTGWANLIPGSKYDLFVYNQ